MLKITITVEDENLDYMHKAAAPTFEMAAEHLGSMARNYDRRIDMEQMESHD